jgi:hypothetical protein
MQTSVLLAGCTQVLAGGITQVLGTTLHVFEAAVQVLSVLIVHVSCGLLHVFVTPMQGLAGNTQVCPRGQQSD